MTSVLTPIEGLVDSCQPGTLSTPVDVRTGEADIDC